MPGTSHDRRASSIWFSSAQRDGEREPVERMAGREAILERQRRAGQSQRFRKQRPRVTSAAAWRISASRVMNRCVGSRRSASLAPALERRQRVHACGDALRVERSDRLRRRRARPGGAPCARARRPRRPASRCARGTRPCVASAPVDQRLADEDLARELRILAAERDACAAARASGRRAARARSRRPRRAPRPSARRSTRASRGSPATSSIHSGSMRAAQRANRRVVSTSSAASTHFGGFFASPDARVQDGSAEPRVPEVPVAVLALHADVARAGRRAAPCAASRSAASSNVFGNVGVPLPSRVGRARSRAGDARRATRCRRRKLTNCARQASTSLRCESFCDASSREELPQRDQRQEIGALVAEPQVRLVGRLLLLERPLARIGHRQRARDDQRFREAAAHRAQRARCAPMRGSSGRRASSRPSGVSVRASSTAPSSCEQLVAVGDRARRRRLEERKRVDVARGRAPPCAGSPTRASCAGSRARCIAAALRSPPRAYRRTQMPSCTRPHRPARCCAAACEIFSICSSVVLLRGVVALDAREPGVDHVADAGHGERGLGDVGRQHDAPARATARRRAAAPAPTAARYSGRISTGACVRPSRERARAARSPVSRISRSPGKEHEDVAGTLAPQVLGGVDDRVLERPPRRRPRSRRRTSSAPPSGR